MRPFPDVVGKKFKVCDNSVFTRTYSRVRQQNEVTTSTNKLSMSSTEPNWNSRGHNVRPLRKDLNLNLADPFTSDVPDTAGVLLLRLDILHPHSTSTHFVATSFFPLSSAFASFLAIQKTKTSTSLATWHPRVRKKRQCCDESMTPMTGVRWTASEQPPVQIAVDKQTHGRTLVMCCYLG